MEEQVVESSRLGLGAILTIYMGAQFADFFVVMLSGFAGVLIALSGGAAKSMVGAVAFIVVTVIVVSVSSWAIADILKGYIPFMGKPYAPSLVALLVGANVHNLASLVSMMTGFFRRKINSTLSRNLPPEKGERDE